MRSPAAAGVESRGRRPVSRRRRRAAGAAALAAAAALGACGGADAGARDVVLAWLAAVAASDGRGACALVDPEVAGRARPSCEAVYGGQGELLGERLGAAGLSVEDVLAGDGLEVTVQGDRALAAVAGAGFAPIELRRSGDDWRVVRGLRPA